MLRHFAAVIILVLAIVVSHHPTNAAVAWCKGDPLVMLDGTLVDIEITLVNAPPDAVLKFTGPTRYTITKPKEVEHLLVPTEALGTNPYGGKVKFVDGGTMEGKSFPVTIDVVVPIAHAPGEVITTELIVRILNGAEARRVEKVEGTSDRTTMRLTITGTDLPGQ